MGGIFGGGNSASKPQYTSMQLQTSALGVPIPVVYGVNRVGVNIIWYNDFEAVQGKAPGKGGSSGDGTYTYTCAVIMGICEGPVTEILQLWASGSETSLENLNLDLYLGTTSQAPYPYVEANHPDQALSYPSLAYIASGLYNLGGSPSLPSHEVEIAALLQSLTLVPGVSTTSVTTLSNSFTIQVPSGVGASIYPFMIATTAFTVGTPAVSVLPAYCTVLAVNGDVITLQNAIFEMPAGTAVNFAFMDANPGLVLADYLTNTRYGMGLDPTLVADLTDYQTYCVAQTLFLSPIYDQQEQASAQIDRLAQLTNSWIFWNGTQVIAVPLGNNTLTGNGVTWVPITTPAYDLTYEDFIFNDGEDPIDIEIVDPSDAYNSIKVEINDRINKAYQSNSLEAKDQASIDLYGLLPASSVQARECCDPNIGMIIANLLLQRSVYIQRTYKFKLGAEFVLLQVGDLVTINDPNIPLVGYPIRIQSIDEDDNFNLNIVGEEHPSSLGVTPVTTVQTTAGGTPRQGQSQPAPAVNTPMIFEPASALTAGIPQVWIGASGTSDIWGGANVWLSADGVNYSNFGQIFQPAIQGVLSAACAAGTGGNPDTANTIAVDLTESQQQIMPTATNADAAALRTLIRVDDELMAYGAAAQASAFVFDLTYLYRGAYSTTNASHSIGAPFCRLDASIFKIDLPASYVGVTLYLKLQSFNNLGGGVQDLADCTAYPYVPEGTGFVVQPAGTPSGTSTVSTQPDGTNIVSVSTTWTASADPLIAGYNVQWSTDAGMTWSNGVTVAKNQTSYTLSPAVPGAVYTFRTQAINTAGNVSSFSTASSVTASSVTPAVRFFDIPMSYIGIPGAAQVFYRAILARAILLPMNFVGSPTAICQVAPTGTVVLTVKKVSAGTATTVGTVIWSAGSTTAVFASAADVAFAVDDIVEIDMQSSADATFGSPSVTLTATQIITSGGGYGNGYGEAYGE